MNIVPKKCHTTILWSVFLLSLAIVIGCEQRESFKKEKYSEAKMMMGTIVQLDVCWDGGNFSPIKNAYKSVWERLEEISRQMNIYDERSEAEKINSSNSEPVSIRPDMYHVLKEAIHFSRLTNGAFDITVWPLVRLWRESEQRNRLPSGEQIKTAQKTVGYQNIQLLENGQIKLLNKETKIDLGGIAKGYAVDEAARIFRDQGITDFYIDAGGDIYVGGRNCNVAPWRIGIRDPRDKTKIIDIVRVTDRAVATSGDYEQYFEVQGERWSHIINPVTGFPQKGVISATVIAPNALEADALATALCVLGGDSGTKYIDGLDGQYASLIINKYASDVIEKFPSQKYKKFQAIK